MRLSKQYSVDLENVKAVCVLIKLMSNIGFENLYVIVSSKPKVGVLIRNFYSPQI
jgi:hypothetical protein